MLLADVMCNGRTSGISKVQGQGFMERTNGASFPMAWISINS